MLGAYFLFDLLTGYAYFWLIDRFQNSYLLFYIIIIGGIGLNYTLKYLAASNL